MSHEHAVYFILFAFVLGGVFGAILVTGARKHHLHDLGQHVRIRGLDCPVCEWTWRRADAELSPIAYCAFLDLSEIAIRERAETHEPVTWTEEPLARLVTKMTRADVKDAVWTVTNWTKTAKDIESEQGGGGGGRGDDNGPEP